MHRSLTKKGEASGLPTDRTKARSTDKQIKGLSYIREIVIRTDEPDIPQITILKVQRPQKLNLSGGLHQLSRMIQRIRLKRLFQGFSQIGSVIQSSKIKLINTNRLVNLLKNREKKLVNYSWLKLTHLKIKQKSKLNTSRLLSKISLILVNKVKLLAFNKLKSYVFSKIKRSITETSESTVKKAEQNFSLQLSKLKNLQISDKFATACKKLSKLQGKRLLQSILSQLHQATTSQLDRFQSQRTSQSIPTNNETALITIGTQITVIKEIKNQNDANLLIIKEFQKEEFGKKLAFYQEAEAEFQKADNQIRGSFEKYNRIQEKELGKILEMHLVKWNKLREHAIYNSRLFVSAIIAKLAKENGRPLNDFIDKLQSFLRICTDTKKIQEFKKNIPNNQDKINTILLQFSNKFIDLTTFGMQPIMQKGFSENEEIFMSEIRYIKQQMKDFIAKYNNPNERPKLKKIFSSKRTKAPEELRDLYSTLNDLVNLIKLSETSKKQEIKDGKNTEVLIKTEINKILNTFIICLKEGNYKKWETFLNQIKKQDYTQLLNTLERINQFLNEKISAQSQKSTPELEQLRRNESFQNETINVLKQKNMELQKKLKALEESKQKEQPKKETDSRGEWESKYKALLEKYEKLQKQEEKSRSAGKALSQRQSSLLKKKIGEKESELEKLKGEIIVLKEKSVEKAKYEADKKKFDNDQKQLSSNFQKIKLELQSKLKIISQNELKIKNLQSEIKRLSNQNTPSAKKTGGKQDYQQLLLDYQNLNKRLSEMTLKHQSSIQQRDEKQQQLQKLRTLVISLQSKISEFESNKSDRQALIRKTNILTNTNQSLKRELQQKNKQLEQYSRQRKFDTEARKGTKPYPIGSGNVENSLELIKQLNHQLDKLKRNEITLEQINKQLQNVHNRGQDVQALMTKIEMENNQFKKSMIQRDKMIFELKNQISRLTTQLDLVAPQINKLTIELNDKDQNLRKLESSIKDRQMMTNKQLQNKREYIKKLQGIIGTNQSMISDLNTQIQKLKHQLSQSSSSPSQIQTLQNTIKELKVTNSKYINIEVSFIELEKRYSFERNKWDQERKKWENQRNRMEEEVRKLGGLRGLEAQFLGLERKYGEERRGWEAERVKWEQLASKWDTQRLELRNQIQKALKSSKANANLQFSFGELEKQYKFERKAWQAQRLKWDEEVKRWERQRQQLRNEIEKALKSSKVNANLQFSFGQLEKKYAFERKAWQGERLKWEEEAKRWQKQRLELQGQIEKAIRSSKANANLQFSFGELEKKYNYERNSWNQERNKWQIERVRLEKQIQNWMGEGKKWQTEKNNWNNERQMFEVKWKQFISKYQISSTQNSRLIGQLNALNGIINDLRNQIALMSGSSINVDNIVWLLANITSNFIRIQPKQNKAENQKTFDMIFKDLMAIKQKFIGVQEQMFLNLQRYIVTFVESDIGKYRYELMVKIQELIGLRQRLTEFLSNEIEISKKSLSYQYSFEIKEISTAAKSLYETPMKTFESGFKMASQVRQAKQKAINPQRLF